MNLRISGFANDSIVDGEGIRLTIFTQGCPHHCIGCHNPHTHSLDGGYFMDIEEIVQLAAENPLLDGVTLSGGEPFLQAKTCSILAKKLHQYHLNIWTYTGYTFETLWNEKRPDWISLLKQTDVLIDGPFQQDKRSLELKFKGSSNQRCIDVKKSLLENRPVLLF